jgi:hypothetical protein
MSSLAYTGFTQAEQRTMVESKHPGFIIDVLNPTDDRFVARLVITPYRDGTDKADPDRKLERNVGKHRAVGLALELLTKCDVPVELLRQIEDIQKATKATQ